MFRILIVILLFSASRLPAAHASALDPFFIGKWVSSSSLHEPSLDIEQDHFQFSDEADEKPKSFRVVQGTDEKGQILEVTSKLQCEASCEAKFYKFIKTGKNSIIVKSGDKIKGNDIEGSSSPYSRAESGGSASKPPPQPKLKHAQSGALLVCETENHLIRIEKVGDKIRYSSWKLGQPESSAPELKLSGAVTYEGSARNATYRFKNGVYTYKIEDDSVCSMDVYDESIQRCMPILTIEKKDQVVSSSKCHP